MVVIAKAAISMTVTKDCFVVPLRKDKQKKSAPLTGTDSTKLKLNQTKLRHEPGYLGALPIDRLGITF